MRRVKQAWTAGVVAAVLIAGAGCRQADGEIPVPIEEQPNKVEDVGRDLQNVAAGEADAERDLQEDLDSFDGTPRSASLVRRLAAAAGAALKGKAVTDGQAQELARLLFVAVTAEELSPGQIEQLGEDIRTAARGAGADDAAAARLSAAATELQSSITLNRKRWYHVF